MPNTSGACTERRTVATREQKLFRRIGNARLAVGIAGVGMAFFVFGEVLISVWWLVVPLVLFLILVVIHARVVESLERANRAVLFYERGLERLEDRWSGEGRNRRTVPESVAHLRSGSGHLWKRVAL
jgi:fatty acid desaturase